MHYDMKHKRSSMASEKSYPEKQEAGRSIPNSILAGMNAMRNVDIHSGSSLQLEDSLKSRIEQSVGYKMDNVELRESHDAAAMGARAFAKGNVVHFAPGQFRPQTEQGRQLITHELTHVAQQAQGGVHADVAGLNVNASERLEGMADHGISGANFAAPAPLPTMNAEAAPIQGDFGSIKRFFRRMNNNNAPAEPDTPIAEAQEQAGGQEEKPTPIQGEAATDTAQELQEAAAPVTSDTVRIEGANNSKADLRRLPNSGPIQAALGEDVGKYKSYGVMLAAIDKLNIYIKTADEQKDMLPTDSVKNNLISMYQEVIHAMDDYRKEMSGYAFKSSSKAKRQARREYVSVLRDIAMNDLNRLSGLQGAESAPQAVSDARTSVLKDEDFSGTIKGGMMNQVYKYKQGYFKPSKGKTELSGAETNLATTIGIKHKDENGESIDARLNQREVATSRLDKLLGGGVISGSKIAQIQQNTSLTGGSYGERKFDAVSGQKGVLMDEAKGKAFNQYNWKMNGIKDKRQAYNILSPDKNRKTVEDRMQYENVNLEDMTVQSPKYKNGGGTTLNAQDPKLQRDMNALFLIDTLAMQTDRHGNNFFIDADEQGNYKGLTGIDNDMSFGVKNSMFGKKTGAYSGLGEQMLIDRKIADKVRSVKKPELELIFNDLLSKEEIDALWERFQMLSKYIDQNEKNGNLVDEWNDKTAERQLKMSGGFGKGFDYYTRHIYSLHNNMCGLQGM